MSSPSSPAPTARFAGLDGLRAIAVALVLVYHLFPTLLPGGFLGVDVFFAISGFLITSLLLRELNQHGKIRLVAFWRRRARRLLPALALVLLVCTTLALLVGGDLLFGIGSQITGAALFMSNWLFIANGADYFARDTPELFRNTWSLSIEEQFYILLPLLLLALWRLRGRVTQALPLIALAILSATLMANLSLEGANPTRIYFGSDTHTFGLLLGAAVAFLFQPSGGGNSKPAPTQAGPARQIIATAVAAAGLATLAWLSVTLIEGSPASFQGGFQLATVAALAVVVAVTRPGVWVGSALDVQPLRWVGERSYGIYLWHWPLLLIIAGIGGPWRGSPADGWVVGGITLVATFGIAALSYRFVEQPVRRLGIRAAIRGFFGAFRKVGAQSETRPGVLARGRQIWLFGLTAALVVTIPATAYAVATAPQQSSAALAIARGQAALDQQRHDAKSGAKEKAPPHGKGAETPEPSATFEGRNISAVGDSVMLASLPELSSGLPGIQVDAAVSRGLGVGVEVVSDLAAEGKLREVLVVGLGTNGPVDAEELDSLLEAAGTRPIVLINAHGERDWIPGVNQTLAAYAQTHRGVVMADWNGAVTGVPDALADDGIHPNPSGGDIYAGAVEKALKELQSPREALGYKVPRR
ncbi:acyltransferase family protein [Leucobacter viscericola]|uniref:acyltransferase family protein n=1 Tax=Leucobacter viscericola TaxID=2714935 RepID=UPI001FCCBF12|nr:acyltransferase family protein [Leucobacter viscericola]